jgi:hypothetical protein
MLSVSSYPVTAIEAAADRFSRQLDGFRQLRDVPESFSRDYFAMLVLALDHTFVHRARGQEGKDGNPANEVRLLAIGILDNGGRMPKDNGIKYDPAKSISGIAVGEEIVLDAERFDRLVTAFLEEIAKRYP